MQIIGYRQELDLLRRNHEYEDVVLRQRQIRTADLAGFAQSPPSYRNCCIGVIVSNGLSGAQHVVQHRALGAPLLFEVAGTVINRWKITASGNPELKEQIPFDSVINAFNYNKAEWKPERILNAKAIGDIEDSIQLDFYDPSLMPFLEGRTFSKLDYILREIITKTIRAYSRVNRRPPRPQELFPLAFRLIAAKIFRDKGHTGGWTSNNAVTALRAVEKYYNRRSIELPPSLVFRPEVLDEIWDIVLTTFHFPNVSEDDLALVFEKTFITPETRRTLGIHSTPLRVAEYIVHKLPFHEIPIEDRYVLEPFSGHGRFLISAMRRMRDLLPPGMSDEERHEYFVRRLVGIERDAFSVEVCRLSLMLADYPNQNGWRIYPEDVFATDRLERELKRARIVLCNPPFEDFKPQERQKYDETNLLVKKPAEFLRRTLATPPELVGLVLPSLFESGGAYRLFHNQLARIYSNIELVALPEVFNYSDATTMLIIASGLRSHDADVSVTCRKITGRHERDAFIKHGTVPSATTTSISPADYLQDDFSLWIPPLSRIWAYLEAYPTLSTIAEIHRGLMWLPASDRRGKKVDKYISDTPKEGYVKGHARAEDHWFQYQIGGSPQYLSLRPQDQSRNAFQYAWDRPKVVCNASRLRRSFWRVGAVADPAGLAFSSRFMVFWPSKNISIFALAALLNSPLCNGFLYSRESGSLNRKITFESLPIPRPEHLIIGGRIDRLSRAIHIHLSHRQVNKAKDALFQIDAEVLRAYDLPPQLEYELLSKFQGLERPVPFEFTGYYPEDFDAYIPLHELISPEFKEGRADRLLERLVFINDPEVSEAMALLRREVVDEGLPS